MLQKKSVRLFESNEDCSRVMMLNGRRQVVVVDRFFLYSTILRSQAGSLHSHVI